LDKAEHYADFDYYKTISTEVENLRELLEADFKN